MQHSNTTTELTTPSASGSPTGLSQKLPARSVTVLAVLMVGAFVVILNETAMNVALSRIMLDLRVDERTAQWLTTGFMLTMAVVIPISGWLMQRLSTRQVFALAMSLLDRKSVV